MPRNFTPDDRAKAAAARAANQAARREAAEREAERRGIGTADQAAARREAARQLVEEQGLRGRMSLHARRARYTEIAHALEQAGYKTAFDPADFAVHRGEHESGRRYLETEYVLLVKDGSGGTRRVWGEIRVYGNSREEIRAAIFAKEGGDLDTDDVEAVIIGDVDLPE